MTALATAGSRRRTAVLLALAAVALLAATAASGASADVGVERVSRRGGERGDQVKLTLGCGFCFPPCKGPKGERHPEGFDHGTCMLGTKAKPPRSFAVSLVPASKAPGAHRCGSNAACLPGTTAPPRRPPYTFLGYAVPPPGGNNPEHGAPPRYVLRFAIPDRHPGRYAYVIWCDACMQGRRGSLIASPAQRLWRLRVRGPGRAQTGSLALGSLVSLLLPW